MARGNVIPDDVVLTRNSSESEADFWNEFGWREQRNSDGVRRGVAVVVVIAALVLWIAPSRQTSSAQDGIRADRPADLARLYRRARPARRSSPAIPPAAAF